MPNVNDMTITTLLGNEKIIILDGNVFVTVTEVINKDAAVIQCSSHAKPVGDYQSSIANNVRPPKVNFHLIASSSGNANVSPIYQIKIFPINGTLVALSNGKYTYTSNVNGTVFFTYVIIDGNTISNPTRVNIFNYSQEDINSISQTQGTFTFDSITYNGDTWQFGTYTTDIFVQNGIYSQMGSFDFITNY
jgi:hypothetical protein